MEIPCWQPVTDARGNPIVVRVDAQPPGLWTVALDHVSGPRKLKLVATGEWRRSYQSDAKCSPDGDLNSSEAPDKFLCTKAAPGALIAKIGGSTAGKDDGTLYVVGAFAVIQIDDKTKGPLFLAMNGEPSARARQSGEIVVEIFEAP